MTDRSFPKINQLQGFSCEITKSDYEETEGKKCVLNFKIKNDSTPEELKMAISRPGLDVLLDGLHKIQSQLTSVAAKSKAYGNN